MSTSLDVIIEGALPDEVSIAAQKLIAQLQVEFEKYLDDAQGMMMDISEDPVSDGLAAFNKQLSELRNRSNRIAQWLMRATEEKRKAQRRRAFAKTAFDDAIQKHLSSDPDIQEIDGQQAKMAYARNMLQKESKIVAYCDQIYTLVLGYHESLKLMHDQLNETNKDLMRQYAVIKQQIALGEVDGGTFPAERPGYNIPTSPQAELEARLAADLGDSGTVTF